MNELFARAVDYREYRVVNSKIAYQNLSRHLPRFWKKTEVHMLLQVFSGSDLNALLSSLARFKDACNLSRVPPTDG